MLPVSQYLHAIDKYVTDAHCVLVRLFECGFVCDRRRIEYHDVGKITRLERPSAIKAQIRCGQTTKASNRFLEGDELLFADVLA